MRYSIVAIFSILTSVVYGQSFGNHDPHGYRPYVAFSTAGQGQPPHAGAQQITNDPSQRRNIFIGLRVTYLEDSLRSLAKEMRTKLTDTNAKMTEMSGKLESTSQALHLTPSVVTVDTDLKGMTDTLTQTKQELAKTQLTLETVKTDLKSTTNAIKQTRTELSDVTLSLEAVKTELKSTTDGLTQTKTERHPSLQKVTNGWPIKR